MSAAAVVNEEFVRRFGKNRDLIDSEIRFGNLSYAIVGVVGNIYTIWLTQPVRPAFYVPIDGFGSRDLSVIVRATSPSVATSALRNAVERVDPDGLVSAIEPMTATIWAGEQRRRFYDVLLSFFAVLSGVVAAVGIYGVVARVAGLRRAELGIRLALGARQGTLVMLVIRQGLRPVVVGVAGGLVCAWWMTDVLTVNSAFTSLLFQITPHDPWTFLTVSIGMLGVAVVACWLPARRVGRLDPAAVLRSE